MYLTGYTTHQFLTMEDSESSGLSESDEEADDEDIEALLQGPRLRQSGARLVEVNPLTTLSLIRNSLHSTKRPSTYGYKTCEQPRQACGERASMGHNRIAPVERTSMHEHVTQCTARDGNERIAIWLLSVTVSAAFACAQLLLVCYICRLSYLFVGALCA